MSHTTAGAATDTPSPRRRRFRLRDARIGAKLGLILLIPLLATTALATARVADGVTRTVEANLVQSLAVVAREASTMAHEAHQERVQAIRLLAGGGDDTTAFTAQASRAGATVEAYQRARTRAGDRLPIVVEARLARVDAQVAGLETLRGQVLADPPITVSATVLRYGALARDVLAFQETVGGVVQDPVLSEQIRAVAALSKAKLHAAEAEAIALVIESGPDSDQQLGAFLGTQTGQQEAFIAFQLAASAPQRAAAQAITGGNVEFAATGAAAMLEAPDGGLAVPAASFAGLVDATRFVEERLQEQLLDAASQTREAVFQQVLIESIAVLVALIVALTLAVLLARMLARSLGQLRQHALAVADRELPATVARLADPRTLGENTPAQLASQVREPVALRSRDEIGQVAQSFTVVHRAAVRVAAEQAALRTSVSAMFLSLARRSQSLVDRMISQLDEIERHEADAKRLAHLFTLDHLATRMRRNDENLLTLAGADTSPPRSDDALVVDVLRAAQSEVEHYDRIEFGTVDTDVSVTAGAVNDVVRLTAELFDNATRFSPPNAPVVCEARRLGDQVILQIEDRGVGMSADQVERVNAWLASPPAVEVTTFRKMGLAVVARLASRHGIRVELRCDPNFGTVAYVALPRPVLILPLSRTRTLSSTSTSPAPPVPSRHLGQPSPRSPEVVHHAANRRGHRSRDRTDRPEPPAAEPSPETPEPTIELPIFHEVETAWFHGRGELDLDDGDGLPWAGRHPVLPAVAVTAPDQEWHTAADAGWRAAAAAADPQPDGATLSGLPRRVPRGQLVPGGVTAPGGPTAPTGPPQRRSPEEVRGLLTAYHRGVQRGREGGPQ